MVCLGDLTDYGGDESNPKERLENIGRLIFESGIPFYLCLGNHDIGAYSYRELLAEFMPQCREGYYSFDAKGLHFAVLDTNYDCHGRHYVAETMQWDQLYVNNRQLEWLKEDLNATDKRTIVVTHGNLDCRKINEQLDPHIVKNYEEVQQVLQKSGRVCAVIQGHYHNGFQAFHNGIAYITLKAIVDGPEATPLLLVTENEKKGLLFQFYDLSYGDVVRNEIII